MVDRVEYTATAGATPGSVTLTVRQHMITFVREVIPDGQLAGMTGHRPVPHVDEFTFSMPVDQARALLDDLATAVGKAG